MDRMEQDLKWRELQELRTLDDNTSENVFVEQSDENLYFSPELNNIILPAQSMAGDLPSANLLVFTNASLE